MSGGGLNFGSEVALSGDGNTALVDTPNDGGNVGAAWAFVRSGSTWTEQGPKLTPTDRTGVSLFGWSMAVSADGNTALFGGPGDNGQAGAAWVFSRSGTTWTQQGSKLTAADENGAAYLGWRVALSGDGRTALAGGPSDNNDAGAAWVFSESGSNWTQQGPKLTVNNATGNAAFGVGLALSTDGNVALIGGGLDNNGAGAAWSFTRSGSTWTQGQKQPRLVKPAPVGSASA